ncbi:LysR family transcriptional regulator [Paracoccus onubensis]|uniref:LysR family transcriptional regulator n=1 Tax=Paracoccus onubensis TaxID=1675788 RepID=UPI00272FD128|nr:LysR family transcriptional regulator [Paracoccus onubensis]MDP0929834.1 LysR family transcriptional regulator [Paracoccus onubensis]
MDRLQSLRIFVAVAEAENFAAGARAVGLSAPSATRGINALEAALGVRLFTRTTRQVRLTDVGQVYLQDVREVLAGLQAADEAATGAARTPVGQLRITCPQEFGRIYITPILTEFLDRHPGVSADVLMIDRIVNIVEEGFDIALRIGPLPSSGLAAIRVGQVRRVLCGAPGYFARRGCPQEPGELISHRLISVAPLDAGRQWRFGPGGEQMIKVEPRLSVSSMAAAIETVRRGWGICRPLSYQIAPDLEAGTLRTVLEDWEPEPLPIHLVHIEGRRAAPKVRALIDFAAERLRQTIGLNWK